MASINLGSFFDGWFSKPPRPIPLHPNFAFIGGRNLSSKKNPTNPKLSSSSSSPEEEEKPGIYSQKLEQFYWECENRPDYRHTPEVERILTEDPIIDPKPNRTPEEIEENKKWWDEFNSSPVVQFLRRAEEITDEINKQDLKENERPYRREDWKLWKELPHVPGLDGRPMPRKSIRTKRESDDKFWDWARQHFFGLWGFRQRPYPPGRPCDVAQAIGYKRLEKRYYDCELQ